MGFSFRDTEGQQAHTGSRRLPDEGDYRVMISKSDLEDGKKNNGSVNLVMEYTIVGGTFAGTVLKQWLAVVNSSETAQNIARGRAEAIRIVTKLPQNSEVTDLVGREMIVRVIHETNEYLDRNGTKRVGKNAVPDNYMTLDGKNAAGAVVPAFVPSVKQEEPKTNQSSGGNSGSGYTGGSGQSGGQSGQDLDDEIPF